MFSLSSVCLIVCVCVCENRLCECASSLLPIRNTEFCIAYIKIVVKDALNVNNKSPKWNNNMLTVQTLWKHRGRLHFHAMHACSPPKSHTSCPIFFSFSSSFFSQSQVILKQRETFFFLILFPMCARFFPSVAAFKMRRSVVCVCVFFSLVHSLLWAFKNKCEFFSSCYSFTSLSLTAIASLWLIWFP